MEGTSFYVGSRPRLHATAFGDSRLLIQKSGGDRARAEVEALGKQRPQAILLVHWLPRGAWDGEAEALYDSIAERIATVCGIGVLAPRLRGVGQSEGDFSVAGWCRDIVSTIDYLGGVLSGNEDPAEIYGVGFGVGGSCLLSVAAGDTRVRGVAAAGSLPELANSPLSGESYIKKARAAGLIRSKAFPSDIHSWRRELIAYAPLHHARRLGDRPVLLVCKEGDKLASPLETARMAEVIGDSCEVRTVPRSNPAALFKSDRVLDAVAGWIVRHLKGQAKRNVVVR